MDRQQNLRTPTSDQLMAVIRTQTEIAKLGLDLQGVMDLVAARAAKATAATGAIVELAEGEHMVYRAVTGAAVGTLGMRLGRSTSLLGRCVELAQTLVCDDAETDPRVDVEACRNVGIRSMVVVPLIHHGEAVGALKVFSARPGTFAEADVRLLELMSELIAASMFHATRFGADELFRKATRDGLTGLANRGAFHDRLRQSISTAQREQRMFAAALLDMDGLKSINDQHGHRAGDAAIAEIARRISREIRESDLAARLGGDEFAVLLTGIASADGARMALERIGEGCNQPFEFEGKSLAIGASMGLAIFPMDATEPERLIEIADQRMYADKRQRKSKAPPPAERAP